MTPRRRHTAAPPPAWAHAAPQDAARIGRHGTQRARTARVNPPLRPYPWRAHAPTAGVGWECVTLARAM
eukprot:2654771-Prymnesium_polylepis.2